MIRDRLSEDVDLFTSNTNERTFSDAVDGVIDTLSASGYTITVARRTEQFSALYGRAEARDFFDVDAIRASGHYTDAQLIEAASERDPGFEAGVFATQLERVNRLAVDDLKEYGVDAAELTSLR